MIYLQISIPILLRYNSINLIIQKYHSLTSPPVVIHAQLKFACTNLNKSMTSTTNVTTFIHIILLSHVFSNNCHFTFITSHTSLLYTTVISVISVCFLHCKENPSYHSSSGSSDPAGRSTSSASSSSSDHVVFSTEFVAFQKRNVCMLLEILFRNHCSSVRLFTLAKVVQ